RNIMESINNGIVALDRAGRITLINKNATAMLGMASADIIGNDYRDTFHPVLARIMDRLRAMIVEQGFAIETRFEHAPFKGFTITLGITAAVLTDENNRRIGIIFVLRDMSASVEIQRLTRLDELKSEFVSNVSHELRTPLASIRVFGELLRSGKIEGPEKVRVYGEHIEAESRRLTRLIDNILDFSSIESGRKTFAFETVDLGDVLAPLLDTWRIRLEHQGFRLEHRLDGELPPVCADTEALGQALFNLIDNAVKYSGESRHIEIRTRRNGEEAVVAVADRGIGIARSEQERIFDRFHRVSSGLTHDVKGSGLGLALVRHIAAAHGGRVTVESQAGKGSTFRLFLPLAAPAPSPDPEPAHLGAHALERPAR
ncbi:MAG: ATP-binding protein, partial [Holophagales bacterium]|nr:ATP-binding protein [Holophagales bacterium]